MADLRITPHAISWGRAPDGRFFLNVEVQVPAANDKVVRVPLMGFVLTKEEEASLKASLAGLVLATTMPN